MIPLNQTVPVAKKPWVQPGRLTDEYEVRTCARPGCDVTFRPEFANQKYCCEGCSTKVKRSREKHVGTPLPRRKVVSRVFYGDRWKETLDCGHVQYLEIAKPATAKRVCKECGGGK